MDRGILVKCIESYRDEIESSIIYGLIAERVGGKIGDVLKNISEMEARHAGFWAKFLRKRGIDVSRYRPRRSRIFFYKLLYRLFGFGLTIKLLERGEREAVELYSKILGETDLEPGEREELLKIIVDELYHEEIFIREESRIAGFLEHVRDAVLGMNDGLVEILSVSTGLAGAYNDPLYVALGGLIVEFAGALSMAIGAYISVKSQRDVYLSSRNRFINLLKLVPSTVHNMVVKIFREKGFSEKLSSEIAREVVEKKIELEELSGTSDVGDPVKSGIITGLFYLLGAFIPLTPYFLKLSIETALPGSLILASLMLTLSGFFIALTAGLDIKKKIVEMILSGLGAAAITYLIGYSARILLGIEVS